MDTKHVMEEIENIRHNAYLKIKELLQPYDIDDFHIDVHLHEVGKKRNILPFVKVIQEDEKWRKQKDTGYWVRNLSNGEIVLFIDKEFQEDL